MNENYDVIIVEDNPTDSELMIRSLQKNHLCNSYLLLEDGEAGMNYFKCEGQFKGRNPELKPMVVFLDLKLPKVDGIEILKFIKSNSVTRNIPVVIITSSKQDPDIKNAYEYGASSYVVKPVDFGKFIETIKTLGYYWLIINEKPRT